MILFTDNISVDFEYKECTVNDIQDMISKAVCYFEDKHGTVDYEDVKITFCKDSLYFEFDVEA